MFNVEKPLDQKLDNAWRCKNKILPLFLVITRRIVIYSTENLKYNKIFFADCSETWTNSKKPKKEYSSKYKHRTPFFTEKKEIGRQVLKNVY